MFTYFGRWLIRRLMMKVLLALLATTLVNSMAYADGNYGNNQGTKNCSYIGSWLGYDENGDVSWTSQVHGQSQSHGTILLEVPGFDFSFGAFEVANTTGNLKGTWVRTGGHSYTMDGYGLATDVTGATLYVMRLACNASVVEDCNVLEVTDCEVTLYLPNPDTDPVPIWNRDPDFGPYLHDTQIGYRITAD